MYETDKIKLIAKIGLMSQKMQSHKKPSSQMTGEKPIRHHHCHEVKLPKIAHKINTVAGFMFKYHSLFPDPDRNGALKIQ